MNLHCEICKIDVGPPDEEPLDEYLTSLGYHKTNKRFCGDCFRKMGEMFGWFWKPEERIKK